MNTTYAQKSSTVPKAADSKAVSVIDSSSQGESLQRKADIADGGVQRVAQRDTGTVQKTNEDIDASEENDFNNEIVDVKKIVKFKKFELSKGFFNKKSIVLYMDENENEKEKIKESVVEWFEKMRKVIPDGLEVYVSNAFKEQRSFNYGSGKICLRSETMNRLMSPRCMTPTVAANTAKGDLKKFADVTLRHELGHILHRQCCEDFYKYTDDTLGKNGIGLESLKYIRDNVSAYAINSYLTEFVAEVFAGLSSGKSFDENIIDVYNKFGGPCQNYLVRKKDRKYMLSI